MHRPPTIEPRPLARTRAQFVALVDLRGHEEHAAGDPTDDVPRVDEQVDRHDEIGELDHWPTDPPPGTHHVAIAPVSTPEHGFDAFYRNARPSIGRALALALGDLDLAVEATDEALARAYERWGKVSALDRPEGWVYRVGLNWATSVLRRRRNHQRLYAAPLVEAPVTPDPAVHASIAELDIDHRAVVVCRHLLGWSVAETAAALRIREGTVKSRLHRANRILQTRLQHLDPTHRTIADKDHR